jgi:hypothetical protein
MFVVMSSYAIRRHHEMRIFQSLERGNYHGMLPDDRTSWRSEHPLETSERWLRPGHVMAAFEVSSVAEATCDASAVQDVCHHPVMLDRVA